MADCQHTGAQSQKSPCGIEKYYDECIARQGYEPVSYLCRSS